MHKKVHIKNAASQSSSLSSSSTLKSDASESASLASSSTLNDPFSFGLLTREDEKAKHPFATFKQFRVRCTSSVTSLKEKAAVVATNRRIEYLLQRFRPQAGAQRCESEKTEETQSLRPRKSFDSPASVPSRKLRKSSSQYKMQHAREDEKVPPLPSRPLSMLRTTSTPDLRLSRRKGSADSDDNRDPFHMELLLSFPKPPSNTPRLAALPQTYARTLPLRGQLPQRTSSLSGRQTVSARVRAEASFAMPSRCVYADLLEAAGIDPTPLPPDVRWNVKGTETSPGQRPARQRAQTLRTDTTGKVPTPVLERPLLITRKVSWSSPRIGETQTVCK